MKEAEELLNRLDNWHRDFRPNRLKIVEDFLKSRSVASESDKPREGWIHAFRLHSSKTELQDHLGELKDPIFVREVIQ
jgi:hypothetical protein